MWLSNFIVRRIMKYKLQKSSGFLAVEVDLNLDC